MLKKSLPFALIAVFTLLTIQALGSVAKGSSVIADSVANARSEGLYDAIFVSVNYAFAGNRGIADTRELQNRAGALEARLSEISARIEDTQAQIDALKDLSQLRQYFNTRKLLAEYDSGTPTKARELLTKYYSYKKLSPEDLIKIYGDVFGRRFSSVTTAYITEGRTSSGRYTGGGTVAVDRAVVPLGTRLLCLNLDKVFRADDTGGLVNGTDTDIFLNDTYANSVLWGRRNTDWVMLDNAKLRQQYEAALEIVSKYTADRAEAEKLLAGDKAHVIRFIMPNE